MRESPKNREPSRRDTTDAGEADASTDNRRALSRMTLLLFAFTCGVSVANIYYAQPLLDSIATTFKIDPAVIGLVITLTQVGYAVGLLLIVPLGDLVD